MVLALAVVDKNEPTIAQAPARMDNFLDILIWALSSNYKPGGFRLLLV
jgi:hypothetical protein